MADTDPTTLSHQLAAAGRTAHHRHPTSDIDGSLAAASHTHLEADVTSLVSDLAGKAATSHTHAESDVTNLTTDLLAGKTMVSASTASTTGSITTTETAMTDLNAVAFTAASGRRYEVVVLVQAASDTAGDLIQINVRNGGGSAPTSASTLLQGGRGSVGKANFAEAIGFSFDVTGLSAGTQTLGVFGVRQSGAGTVTLGSATAGLVSRLYVKDIGT